MNGEIHRFAKKMISLRMSRDLPSERLDMTLAELLRKQPIEWHGVKLNEPDWGHDSHTVAATVRLLGYRALLHLIINAYWEPRDFDLPHVDHAQGSWRRCIDTYLDPPDDISDLADAPHLGAPTYCAQPRSVVLLLANLD
jgi:glycogen operon protein